MAHCTYDEVDVILQYGSSTELNEGSIIIGSTIEMADTLIDARLSVYGLTVSGSSQDLIMNASRFWTASLYLTDALSRKGYTPKIVTGKL